ncbi:uncharacterized protein LOC143025540 isoform X2 [Oratosquilla oratoria]
MPLPEEPELRFAVCLLRQAHRADDLQLNLPGNIGPFLTQEILSAMRLENVSIPESCLVSLCSTDVKIYISIMDGQPSLTYFVMYSVKQGQLDTCSKDLEDEDELVRSLDAEGNTAYHINCCYRLVLFPSPHCLYASKEKLLPLMTMYVFSSLPKCLTSILCSPSIFIETIARENKTTVWVPLISAYLSLNEFRSCYDIARKINEKEREEGKRDQMDTVGTVAYFSIAPMHDLVIMKQPFCQMLSLNIIKLIVYGSSPLPESCLNLFCQSPLFHVEDLNAYLSFKIHSSGEIDQCLNEFQVSPAVIRHDNLNMLSMLLESPYSIYPSTNKQFFLVPQRNSCLINFQNSFETFASAVQRTAIVPKECSPLLCGPVFFPTVTDRFRYLFNINNTEILPSCYLSLPPTPGLSTYTKLLKLTPQVGFLLVKPECLNEFGEKFTLFSLMNEKRTLPSHCFAELCHQNMLSITVKNKGLIFHFGFSENRTNEKCFRSIQESSFPYQREVDLQNCTMLTIRLPRTIDPRSSKWDNDLVFRDPSCGYNTKFGILTAGRFMNFLATKLYASVPENIRKPYQCLARKLENGYDLMNLKGAVDNAERLRAYAVGVKLNLPSSCHDLACEQSVMVYYISQAEFSGELKTYITIFAQDMQSSKVMTKCITDLKTAQSTNVTVREENGPLEVRIPSSVSMTGAPSLGIYFLLLITFPDCVVTNGFLRASHISQTYLFLKDFPSSCRAMICDSDTLFHEEVIGGYDFVYMASKKATVYSTGCLSQLEEKEDSFGIYTVSESIMKKSQFQTVHSYVIDFDPPPTYSSTYAYLLLQKRLSNIDDSCLRCSIKCDIERFRDRLIYMMVPHNDSIHECNTCFSTGHPVTSNETLRPERPEVVVLINSTIILLLHRSENRAEMVAHESLLHQVSGYLYFYSHNLFQCMSIDQSLHSFGQETPSGYEQNLVFTEEVWSICLNEIQANANFACTPKENYTLCSENRVSSGNGNIKLLFFLPCRNFSADTLRLMSHPLVLSHLGWNSSNVHDRVCHTNTFVAKFTTYSRILYYESLGSAADIRKALGNLYEHWEILPSSICVQGAISYAAECSKVYNLKKLYEVINSQTGVKSAELSHGNILYQCLIFNHEHGSIKLLRVISAKGDLGTCNSLFTHPNTTYAIKERDDIRMLTISKKQEEGTTVSSRIINDFKTRTGQCPMIRDSRPERIHEVLSLLAAAVAQNNSDCVEDACSGHFKLLTNIHNDLAVLGPLTLSIYGTTCYAAVPSSTWKAVDLALSANRVTLNKFWPGCYFDHIVMWNSPDVEANEWDYLTTGCRVREILFFIINMLLVLLTILANLVVIVTIFKSRGLAFKSRYRLQVNLAISDLMMGIFVGGQALHDQFGLMTGSLTLKDLDSLSVFANFKDVTEEFAFGLQQLRFPRGGLPAFCGFVFSLCSFVSLVIMSLLTLELLLGSSYAELHRRLFTPFRLTLMFIFLWVGGIIFSILLLQKEEGHVLVAYFDPVSKLTTSLPSSNISSASFIAFYSAVTLFSLTSLFVVVVSIISIIRVFGAQKRLRKENIDLRGDVLDSQNRAFRDLVAIFVSAYLLSVVPLATGSTGNLFLTSPLGHYVVWWIYMASSAWNPFLYNIRLRKFQKEAKNIFSIIKEVLVPYWRALMPERCDAVQCRKPNRRKAMKTVVGYCPRAGDSKLKTLDPSGLETNSECNKRLIQTHSSTQTLETVTMEQTPEAQCRKTTQKELSISPVVETANSCSEGIHNMNTSPEIPLPMQNTETLVHTPAMTEGIETPIAKRCNETT